MAAVALDANVVIGFLEPTDEHHERAVEEIQAWLGPQHRRIMPMTVFAEILVHPLRRGTENLVEEFVQRGDVELIGVDRALAWRAAELRARWEGLQLGDAFALATAIRHEAELLTFDWGLWHKWDRSR